MEIELQAHARVNFTRDGIDLTPRDLGQLIVALDEDGAIGADEYCMDGVVGELERFFARDLGKQAALFLPTGTLANHLALRSHAPGGGRVVVQTDSHLYRDSGDAAQTLSGIHLVPLANEQAAFSADDLVLLLERNADEKVHVPICALSIESPLRRHSGRRFPLAELEQVIQLARNTGMALHRDGARIHLEAAFLKTTAAELAAPFDTVYCSLYKCFNAPFGAILAGSEATIEPMRATRRAHGGALAQGWPAAAIALHYARGFARRMSESFVRAGRMLEGLNEISGLQPAPFEHGSHVIPLELDGIDSQILFHELQARGIDIWRPDQLRSVAQLPLHLNESLLHRDVGSIVDALRASVAAARE